MKSAVYLGLSALAFGMALAPVQQAQAQQSEYQQNAPGQCVGALPAYQANLRFSPYAVTNNGTASSFVTCAAIGLFPVGVDLYGVYITNPTGASVDVSCTFASGQNGFRDPAIPKTQTYPAGSAGFMIWDAVADNGGVQFSHLSNLSCILPPGLSLDFTANVASAPL